MPITIQEIIASDTISQLVDKTNFNFDQLLLNGGGPAGPIGGSGPTGPAGGRGPKGSTWYEDTATVLPGTLPNAAYPTATPRISDYYLQLNGEVWEYDGLSWLITTVDLMGPIGPAGAGGGFGGTFGSPYVNQGKNTRYNQPFGYEPGVNGGATTDNEGVPSIVIGGVPTTADEVDPSIPLTAKYIIPDAIAGSISSDVSSLFIHQKDTAGTSITFQGGGFQPTDKYNQTSIGSLSNIHLGVDDRLVMRVPKAPTSPTSQADLIGFQVLTDMRSQSYEAGRSIRLVTGQDNDQHWPGQNSNFEIEVGTGNTATNKFKVATLGATVTTTIESGGSIDVTPVTGGQITNVGTFQVLAGNTNFVTSPGGQFRVTAGSDIRLQTNLGTSIGGNIGLYSAAGGITATSAGGTISIAQTETTTVGNIQIDQHSTEGELLIRANSSIVLGKYTSPSALAQPSITLDYAAITGGSTPNPHIRTVGRLTWAATQAGSTITQPYSNVSQSNSMDTVLGSDLSIFRQTGTESDTAYVPAATMESWVGGLQATTGINAGLIKIVMGNESVSLPVPSDEFMYDNSLELAVRDTDGMEEYISLSKSKLGLATPLVLKRVRELNSLSNSRPNSLNFSWTSSGGSGKPTTKWGWNTTGAQSPGSTAGMPTTADLNVPLIYLSYGIGQSITGFTGQTQSNTNYDYTFNFPEGAYPGQKLTLKVYHQAAKYLWQANQSSNFIESWGMIQIRLPKYRNSIPQGAAWSSWYRPAGTNGGQTYSAGYTTLYSGLGASDMLQGEGKVQTYDLIWDGLEISQWGMNTSGTGHSAYNRESSTVQFGWSIMGTSYDVINIGGPPT